MLSKKDGPFSAQSSIPVHVHCMHGVDTNRSGAFAQRRNAATLRLGVLLDYKPSSVGSL